MRAFHEFYNPAPHASQLRKAGRACSVRASVAQLPGRRRCFTTTGVVVVSGQLGVVKCGELVKGDVLVPVVVNKFKDRLVT